MSLATFRIFPSPNLVRIVVFLVIGLFTLWSPASAQDSEIVRVLTKARSNLGADAKLNAVKSLKFAGTITTPQGENHAIEIVMKKPFMRFEKITRKDGLVEETGLNDYESWKKVYKNSDPGRYQLIPSSPIELNRIRASTYETLNFFSTKASRGQTMEYLGQKMVEGVEVQQVKVAYGNIYFIRFIDSATGELLLTEVETGLRIVESGEIVVDGIRFPKTLTNFMDGKELHRLEIREVLVNPKVDDSLFSQPALPGPRKK